jgi:uncharacterized membrane protein (DUF4010 family)
MNDAPAPALIAFGLTIALSFLVGLGLREYYIEQGRTKYFGTVRTYAFIGMLGFALFQLPQQSFAYLVGLAALSLFLLTYYRQKLDEGSPGLIGVLTALLTYMLGPLALTNPPWFLILFSVSILFVLSAKQRIRVLSERINQREVVTLATFLTLAGVILPLLPTGEIAPFLPITPRNIWTAVVVSTAISYLSYGLQTFVWPQKGLFLTGLLGGLYSSTATTLIIARRTRNLDVEPNEASGAMVVATSMMYFRLILLIAVFDLTVAARIAVPMTVLGLLAAGIAYWLAGRHVTVKDAETIDVGKQRNPLELSSAVLFAFMFVLMTLATKFALDHRTLIGLRELSFLVGFYDIDPFIISLLQSRIAISHEEIAGAVIISTAGNNVLKALYVVIFANRSTAVWTVPTFVALAALSLAYLVVIS